MKFKLHHLFKALMTLTLISGVLTKPLNSILGSGQGDGTRLFSVFISTALAQPDSNELMTAGPLGDYMIGDENAPVTMIEYASMTCGSCAQFHNIVLPELKRTYIDTGKLRVIMREFPLDPLSAGAFMLARCTGDDHYGKMIEILFQRQNEWVTTNDPLPALFSIVKQAGLTRKRFDQCLSDQKLLDAINHVKDRASKKFNVSATPTFFINGKMIRGGQSFEEFKEILDPLLDE